MRGELRRLVKAPGTTGVYVTHDQSEALSMADRIAVMNDGKIVQTGAPEALYNRPATRFVADFLGEANFLDGTVAEPGPPARIDTPSGTLLTAKVQDVATGGEVTCCVRPERIQLLPGPDGDAPAGSLRATVESTTYLGDIRQFVCRLAAGEAWRVSMLAGRGQVPTQGQDVTLRIAPQDVVVLAE